MRANSNILTMSSPILTSNSQRNESIHRWPYVALVQLREGENQIPVPTPDDVTPLDMKPFEVGQLAVFIVLWMWMIQQERAEINFLSRSVGETQPRAVFAYVFCF